jgi:hypothetical protein
MLSGVAHMSGHFKNVLKHYYTVPVIETFTVVTNNACVGPDRLKATNAQAYSFTVLITTVKIFIVP